MRDNNLHPAFDEQQLDRLVDGELTRQEYAELVRSFDEHPDGWRRCALAFLEAQAWGRELNAVRQGAEVRSVVEPAVAVPSRRRPQWLYALAVAASFLAAFALGLATKSLWTGASTARDGEPLATDLERRDWPHRGQELAPGPGLVPEGAGQTPAPANMRLVVERGEDLPGGAFELPVYDWSPDRVRWLSDAGSDVPPEVRRALQRMGDQVQWQRHVVPLQATDGRRIVVPVEQLRITPVGRNRYQ